MKKFTSLLCCLLFAIAGIGIASTASDPSPGTGYKTAAAATMQPLVLPTGLQYNVTDNGQFDLSEEFVRTLAKEKGVLDTCYVYNTDTIEKVITKWRKVPAPPPEIVRDTIREAYYYIATQVGNKEGPTGECIPIYEVHQVDEICTDNPNSSIERAIEYERDVGD